MHGRAIGPKRVYIWTQTLTRGSKTSQTLFTGSWFGARVMLSELPAPLRVRTNHKQLQEV